MRRFIKKTVVITGGASGIGAAAVHRFHQEGANVVISDINQELGESLSEELGAQAIFCAADVSNYEDVNNLMRVAYSEFGSLDVLFNNAGIGCIGLTPDLPIDEWQRVLAINLDGVFFGCKAAIPYMRKSGSGVIINTASASGLAADYGFTAYNAAKGAVINYTRAVAIDHAREGIRVNSLCPGPVQTPITADAKSVPGLEEKWADLVPIGRWAKPEEMASIVAFLASDDASYMVGATVVADGGLGAHTGQPNMIEIMTGEH